MKNRITVQCVVTALKKSKNIGKNDGMNIMPKGYSLTPSPINPKEVVKIFKTKQEIATALGNIRADVKCGKVNCDMECLLGHENCRKIQEIIDILNKEKPRC